MKRPAAIIGTGAGATVLVAPALSAWARCSDLGPVVRVHPAIRALDAGRANH